MEKAMLSIAKKMSRYCATRNPRMKASRPAAATPRRSSRKTSDTPNSFPMAPAAYAPRQ
jgi:hypothetical protein